jgi:hypothetical protein
VNASQFTYELSLAFVVIVVTTGVSTVEGAIQGGMGFVVIQQLLTYLPARFGGNSLTIVLFAFGALTYVAHPEGILEFQKRRWTLRFERLLFGDRDAPAMGSPAALGPPTSAASGPGPSPSAVGNMTLDLSAGDRPGGGRR